MKENIKNAISLTATILQALIIIIGFIIWIFSGSESDINIMIFNLFPIPSLGPIITVVITLAIIIGLEKLKDKLN